MKAVFEWEMTSFGSHGHLEVKERFWLVEIWHRLGPPPWGYAKPYFCRIRLKGIRDKEFGTIEEAKKYADQVLIDYDYRIIGKHLLVLK